jgi:hypothetical protein
MWYPPRERSENDEIQLISKIDEIPKVLLPINVGDRSMWKNFEELKSNKKKGKNSKILNNSNKLTYLSANKWQSISKEKIVASCREYVHGVEVRLLGKDHFLCGEYGLFATIKFFQFDIVGEYTGKIVEENVYGHYVAALEDKGHSVSLGINAEDCGNEMRFINSYLNVAFKPNVTMRTAYINTVPHILLVCLEEILPGDEFLLDYGEAYNNAYLLKPPSNTVASDALSMEALFKVLPGAESSDDEELAVPKTEH